MRLRSAVPGAGAADRLIDHTLCDRGQFHMLGLADRAQHGECLLGGAAAAAAEDADSLVDDGPAGQRGLQLGGQRHRLGEHLRIVHGDRGWRGEQLPSSAE